MQAVELTGRDAEIATLKAKLSVATLRGKHGMTPKICVEQRAAAARYAARLRKLGVQS